jgi:hypothetical protein
MRPLGIEFLNEGIEAVMLLQALQGHSDLRFQLA